MTGTVRYYRGSFVKVLYNEICVLAGHGNNLACIYIKTTFFFRNDIIDVVVAPPVID